MIEKIWEDRGQFDKERVVLYSKKLGICPEVVAILDKRGINLNTFFSLSGSIPNALLISDMEKGVEIVKEFAANGKKIAVVNDYDVDGVTSGLIMKEALSAVGGDSFIITPKRLVDGYGISKRIVELAKEEGTELIVTTDNGISAFEAIEYAKSLGFTVVVTDHHDVHKDESGEDRLPIADAVIDAKRKDSEYPFIEICGAEVALKFACVLFAKVGIDDTSRKKLFRRFTELAAIGTVCDVMPLIEENRSLVKAGLKDLKASQIIGLRQLMKVQQIEPQSISSYDIGFRIGPCINAMSRILDDTDSVLSLLEEKDHIKAKSLAEKISKVNEERKSFSEKAKKDGLEKVDLSEPISILYIPDSNPSVMGIAAGKIKDETGHPAVCFTDDKDGILKGSGRSVEDYDMFAAFSKYSDLYESFGGHPGAIGISIKKADFDKIKELINKDAQGKVFKKKTIVDLFLPMSAVTDRFVEDVEKLEPFGEGNPAPVLCDDTCLLEGLTRMGQDGKYLRLSLRDKKGKFIEAVFFGDADEMDSLLDKYFGIPIREDLYQKKSSSGVPVSFLYTPKFNFWNGRKNIQYQIRDYAIRDLT